MDMDNGNTNREVTTIMPTYVYKCMKCKNEYDVIMTISEHEKKKPTCPACRSNSVEQLITSFNVRTSKKS